MSRQSESGCLILLGIGGFLFLISILKENPILILYAFTLIFGILLITLFFNLIHTVYLIYFNAKVKMLLRINDFDMKTHAEKLLKNNRTEKSDIDESYLHFIRGSKIFD